MSTGYRGWGAGLLAFALWTTPALAKDDARAMDAVAFFGAMCGQRVANWTLPVDHDKYQFHWLDQKEAAEFGESLKDLVVWSVTGSASGAHMLHYVTPSGICGVELEAADGKTVDAAFEILVQAAAKRLSLQPSLLSDDKADGSRTRIWRLGPAGSGYELGLSVPIAGDRAPQAIMTMAEASDEDEL